MKKAGCVFIEANESRQAGTGTGRVVQYLTGRVPLFSFSLFNSIMSALIECSGLGSGGMGNVIAWSLIDQRVFIYLDPFWSDVSFST